jgi:SAM-dependent methyltransferase
LQSTKPVNPQDPILAKIDSYYSAKLAQYGPSPMGVDWNSEESQLLRFKQLATLLPPDVPFSLLDYGCGYGALYRFLKMRGFQVTYTGYDVSLSMIESARRLYGDAIFVAESSRLRGADFLVASGIFNVKMDVETSAWEDYVMHTIDVMNSLASRGFAFNVLTAYADEDRKRSDLYYADPHRFFDLCRRYSQWVAILHDYGLYEFTVLVRKAKNF